MRLSLRSAVQNNQVGGNVQVDNNSGSSATVVSNNTIGGNLQCAGNSPGVTDNGSKNNVTGTKQGQCAGANF
jgi:alpha-L-fucosidase 2